MYEGIPQQCRFSHARGANDGDESRGRFIGDAVDEGDVKALLFDLGGHRVRMDRRARDIGSGVHRGSARLALQACRGWRKQKPLGFVLAQCECMECMMDEWNTNPLKAVPSSPWTSWTPGAACVLVRPSWSAVLVVQGFEAPEITSRDSRSRLHQFTVQSSRNFWAAENESLSISPGGGSLHNIAGQRGRRGRRHGGSDHQRQKPQGLKSSRDSADQSRLFHSTGEPFDHNDKIRSGGGSLLPRAHASNFILHLNRLESRCPEALWIVQ